MKGLETNRSLVVTTATPMMTITITVMRTTGMLMIITVVPLVTFIQKEIMLLQERNPRNKSVHKYSNFSQELPFHYLGKLILFSEVLLLKHILHNM
jgi:hypothetical protein